MREFEVKTTATRCRPCTSSDFEIELGATLDVLVRITSED